MDSVKTFSHIPSDVLQVNSPGLPRYLEIWRDSPVSVSLDLIIKNIGSHDLPACTPPCEQRSVLAVLSEDTQYNPLYDERIKITLRPGSNKTCKIN